MVGILCCCGRWIMLGVGGCVVLLTMRSVGAMGGGVGTYNGSCCPHLVKIAHHHHPASLTKMVNNALASTLMRKVDHIEDLGLVVVIVARQRRTLHRRMPQHQLPRRERLQR